MRIKSIKRTQFKQRLRLAFGSDFRSIAFGCNLLPPIMDDKSDLYVVSFCLCFALVLKHKKHQHGKALTSISKLQSIIATTTTMAEVNYQTLIYGRKLRMESEGVYRKSFEIDWRHISPEPELV